MSNCCNQKDRGSLDTNALDGHPHVYGEWGFLHIPPKRYIPGNPGSLLTGGVSFIEVAIDGRF